MKKLLIIIMLSIVSIPYGLCAQGDGQRIGLFGSFNIYQHRADFRTLPGVTSCCPKFIDGDGAGMSLGILYEYPIVDGLFIGLRAGFLSTNATFQTDEPDTVNLNGNVAEGIFRHTIETDWGDFIFQPQIQWRFWNNFMLHGGAELALGKFGNTYKHYEEIIKPDVGTFENNKRIRLESSGEITDINFMNASLFFGLSYEFVLNKKKTWFLAPEAMFFFGLQDNVKDINWATNSFRFGLALKYSPASTHRTKDYIIDTIRVRSNQYTIPTIVEGKEYFRERIENPDARNKIIIKEIHRTDTLFSSALFAKITTTAIDEDGSISKVSEIHVSTQFVTEIFPVLPFVFFEKRNSQLPPRYLTVKNAYEFQIPQLEPNSVAIQRNILNIVGKRMQELPSATVTLLGAADPTSESADCNLAATRAQVVKNYLVNTWGIQENRIILKPLKDPCIPSAVTKTQSDDGFADNRRVEIYSDTPELLSALAGKRYNEPYKVTPPVIKHDPIGSTTEDIASWLLVGTQGPTEIFTKSGVGVPIVYEHKISTQSAMLLRDDMPLQLTYVIKDNAGNTATATEEFNVTKDTAETEIKRISLTAFDVGSSEVTRTAGEQIKLFIKDLPADAEISIVGYTDKLGNEDFNRKLANDRANSIAEYMKKVAPSAKITAVNGLAFDDYPPGIYSYNTPEERFLSRTVQIEIRFKTNN